MKKISLFAALALSATIFVGCSDETAEKEKETEVEKEEVVLDKEQEPIVEVDYDNLPQFNENDEEKEFVTMKTNQGDIVIELYPKYAPKAVENFLELSKKDYYDGVTFHRVIADFMIQGGDPTATGAGGESIYGSAFEDEFNPNLFHVKGALSMANSGANTNGSQFFIVQNSKLDDSYVEELRQAGYPEQIIAKYQEFGGTPHLDGRHTVFGQVIEGMDIVDKIAAVQVDEASKPLEDIIIEDIEIKE